MILKCNFGSHRQSTITSFRSLLMWASPFEKGGVTFAVPHPIAVHTSSAQLHIQGVAHSL